MRGEEIVAVVNVRAASVQSSALSLKVSSVAAAAKAISDGSESHCCVVRCPPPLTVQLDSSALHLHPLRRGSPRRYDAGLALRHATLVMGWVFGGAERQDGEVRKIPITHATTSMMTLYLT